jgi:hypothetical protein
MKTTESLPEAMESRATMSVPAAGAKYFGLSKNGSYEAARRGDIPTIRVGRKIFVPVKALEKMLAEAGRGRLIASS